MMTQIEERWGDFVFLSDFTTHPKPTEVPGPRSDFEWRHAHGPWDHPLTRVIATEAEAEANPSIPMPEWLPAEETFLSACVIADDIGTVEAHTAFLRSSHPEVTQFASTETVPADRTLLVAWSARFGKPVYCDAREGPIPLNASTVEEATVVQEKVEQVMVANQPGVLRLWSPRLQQPMYGARLPTVILNWYEGPILWTVQSSFLTVPEVTQVADSIRPTSVPGTER